MRLQDMKRSGDETARFTSIVADERGANDYELTISGTPALVEQVFEKSDFEITISPDLDEETAGRRTKDLWAKYAASVTDIAPAEDLDSLAKVTPRDAARKNSIVVSLRRIRGEGTYFAIWLPLLFIPRGVSLFLVAPPALVCQGSVFPAPFVGGDPDLFLTLNGITTPVVSASRRAGPAIDTVSFAVPLAIGMRPVVPFYRIFGFATSLTGFFCWSV